MYDVYWYSEDQYFMKPEMRENATMVIYKNHLILYGGLGAKMFKTIWVMNIGTHSNIFYNRYVEMEGVERDRSGTSNTQIMSYHVPV